MGFSRRKRRPLFPWYRILVQERFTLARLSRLVRRADIFYFRGAVPQSLTERLGLPEIKFSLRTSDPKLATRRCCLLSDVVDALFEGMTRMYSSPTDAIHDCVRGYFRNALIQSLELAHMLPRDPTVDLGAERASLHIMLAEKRQQLGTQSFPPSVKSDATALLHSIHPGQPFFGPETLQQACSFVLRARFENERILAAQLAGRYDDIATQERRPYSPEQLKEIFDSPVFRGHDSEARRSVPGSMLLRDGKFWVPLIA